MAGSVIITVSSSYITVYGIGILDRTSTEGLRKRVEHIISERRVRGVICSFRHTSFVQYLGVRSLQDVGTYLQKQAIPFVPCEASACVAQVLCFWSVPIVASWEDAIAQIRDRTTAA